MAVIHLWRKTRSTYMYSDRHLPTQERESEIRQSSQYEDSSVLRGRTGNTGENLFDRRNPSFLSTNNNENEHSRTEENQTRVRTSNLFQNNISQV